jgi:GalNAc-alpha-(1->4)-GalNAc-alpha-(1->3)-diNAcBac-PP-undecaprenol alpha-1,4-N-acetyl-D-galactosaminyltransferase
MTMSEKFSHICFVLNDLAPGGIPSVVATYANRLAEEGYDVVLLLIFKSDIFFHIDKRIKIIEPIHKKGENRYLYAIGCVHYIRRSIKKIKPDILISNGEWINGFVLLATISMKVPVFVTEHSNPDLLSDRIVEWLKKKFYKRAKGVLVLSEYAAEVVKRKTGNKNVFVVCNPVKPVLLVNEKKRNSIIAVGRMTYIKGYDVLLRSFAQAVDHSWSLEFVGDGPMMPVLKGLASELGIESRVIFWGKRDDVQVILSGAKIFALSSVSECFPLALIEAMSVPLACVASDCMPQRGKEALIQHGENGLMYPVGDIKALTESLNLLMTDNNLREKLSANAVLVRQEYALTKVLDHYLSVMESVL